SLCHVENHIRRFKRPEWIAHRDFAPIEPLPDDCLLAPMTPFAEYESGIQVAAE
ncbi:MAG: proline hydroxylase, partial [Rhodospirillaceae bacterium]|nr:proline hydroxylase [Rhodospirillaceae bacterium]